MKIENNDRSSLEKDLVLLDFSATWCGPCKMFMPIFEEFSNLCKDAKCFSVDVDDNDELAKEFAIMSVPTVVLLKDGKEVKRNNGYMSVEQLEEFIK